jgi:hypothetical protein
MIHVRLAASWHHQVHTRVPTSAEVEQNYALVHLIARTA